MSLAVFARPAIWLMATNAGHAVGKIPHANPTATCRRTIPPIFELARSSGDGLTSASSMGTGATVGSVHRPPQGPYFLKQTGPQCLAMLAGLDKSPFRSGSSPSLTADGT